MINPDAILAELLEIESLLQDDRLNDQDRSRRTAGVAKLGQLAQASQTFYRIDNRPSEAVSLLLH
jgi:hypothetical protein